VTGSTGSYSLSLLSATSCTYVLNPSSQSFAVSGGSGSFSVTAPAGCAWSAISNVTWITTNSSNSGSGTVNYIVSGNTDSARSGTISVGGQIFTVNQSAGGGGCPATNITPGQTINGTLTTADCIFSGTTRYVDVYNFSGTAGQQIVVVMSSSTFDTYLYLLDSSNQLIGENDDSNGNTNSRIPVTSGFFTLPSTGTYTIYATSYSPFGTTGSTGAYAISLVPAANSIQFSAASYTVNEASSFASITVTRSGNLAGAATVKYTTSDATDVNFKCNPTTAGQITGAASRKCDYHIASGRLRFAAGESSKTIILSVVNDVYVEPSESLTITLSNPTGATLGTTGTSTVSITDNDAPGQANPINGTAFYVRMLYVDLLSREPDSSGNAGWIHRIDFCGQPGEPPPPCDRVTVGGDGFLRSAEFFDREFFVIRLYRTALGRILRYDDVGDLAFVSGFLTDADLESNKQEVVTEMMSRSEFGNIYNSLTNSQYVDTMIQTAAVTLPAGVRDSWVSALSGSTKTRAVVFRELSERPEVSAKYLHEAQVVSCYYGFFTRNPDGAYLNYLQRLDSGEINLGDLANAFINAAEYRQRFGP
jgi:hypothetical protein